MIETVFFGLFFSATRAKTDNVLALVLLAVFAQDNLMVKLAVAVLSVLEVHAIATHINGGAGVLALKYGYIVILRGMA